MYRHVPVGQPQKHGFSMNYFTSIGLSALTEEMREHLMVSQAFNDLFYVRADVLLSRTRPT